eukprot:169839-Hanusia_phi.AAC.1
MTQRQRERWRIRRSVRYQERRLCTGLAALHRKDGRWETALGSSRGEIPDKIQERERRVGGACTEEGLNGARHSERTGNWGALRMLGERHIGTMGYIHIGGIDADRGSEKG